MASKMKKKSLIDTAMRAAMTLLLAVMTATAWADEHNGWIYSPTTGGCVITACTDGSTLSTITIPRTLGGYPVVAISSDVFSGFNQLQSIIFYSDASVENMPRVSNCPNFKDVCTIDVNETDPEKRLKKNLLPASIKEIDNRAFKGTAITALDMPGVTSVGFSAFEGCVYLASATFHHAATIGEGAFSKIPGYSRTGADPHQGNKIYVNTTVTYPGPMSNWNAVNVQYSPSLVVKGTYDDKNWYFGWCGDIWDDRMELYKNASCLYWTIDADGNMAIDCIPQDIIYENYLNWQYIRTTKWEDYSTAIKTLTMNHVYVITMQAFDGMPNLTTVNVSSTLNEIQTFAFLNCPQLKDFYFDGTESQWASVTKGEDWHDGSHANYAEHWHCTVTFDANGHGTTPAAQSIQWSDETKATQPADLSADGYLFRGWFTEAACTTPWDFDDAVPGNMTLYAGWSTPCTVTFDANGHGTAPAAQTGLWSHEDKATEPETLTADGYLFRGWFTEAACTTPWDFNDAVPGDMTLYAGWGEVCAATFTTAAATIDIPYGQEWTDIPVAVSTLTLGWFQNAGQPFRQADAVAVTPFVGSGAGTGFTFVSSAGQIDAYKGAGAHTVGNRVSEPLTAVGQSGTLWVHIPQAAWEAAAAGDYSQTLSYDAAFLYNGVSPAETYIYSLGNGATVNVRLNVPAAVTLTFDANGGSGEAMNAASGRVGIAMTLPASTYTAPTGKQFLCWNTQADGSGTRYYAGQEYIFNANTTLYAEWGGDYVIDLTSATEQDITMGLSGQLTVLNGYFMNDGNQMGLDIDLDGTMDVEIVRKEVNDQWTASVKKLTNLTKNYHFVLPTPTEAGEYGSVLFLFGSGETVQQPAIELLYDDNGTYNRGQLVTLKDGQLHNLMLDGRTLYRDGYWNTLCLPFAVGSFTGTPLDGATVMELDTETAYNGHVTGLEGTTLYLNFKDATSIEAGKPYIVKWATTAANIVNPVFHGVTVTTATEEIPNPYYYSYEDPENITVAAPTDVSFSGGKFCGTYDPTDIYNAEHNKYFLGDSNQLYWPDTEGFSVKAFRAYFDLSSASAPVREFHLSFGGEAMGILSTKNFTNDTNSGAWYTLDGRRLDGKPTTKGIYIYNGIKRVIKH